MRYKKNLLIWSTLFFSILIKFFSSSPYLFISMDEPKYLKLAKNLPSYVLFNKDFFISHPPFYPFVIKLFGLIMPDYVAGLLVSQVSTAGLILLTFALFRLLKVEDNIICASILFLSFSHLLYYWTNMIYKETFFSFLVYLFIFVFILSLIKDKQMLTYISSIIGFLLAFTTDLIIFIFPVIICIILLYGKDYLKQRRYKILSLPILFICIGYSIWLLGRYLIYANNIYYPAGVDGLIEKVSDYKFIHILVPRGFHWTKEITQSGISFNLLHYLKYLGAFFNLIPPFHISSANITKKDICIFIMFYIPLIVFLFRGIILSIIEKNRIGFLMLIIFFSFLSPIIFGISDPRFSIPALIPVSFFIGKAVTKIKMYSTFPNLLIIFLLCFIFYWIFTHPYFFAFSHKIVQLEKTSEFIDKLPEDGIMAQFGYPPEIAYLTDKRVICLPLTLEEFEKQINLYNIHYIIIGTDETYSGEVIRYIKSNSKRFREIKKVVEKYPYVKQGEKVYVFEVTH